MTSQRHMLGLLQGQEYSPDLLAPYPLPERQGQSSALFQGILESTGMLASQLATSLCFV